MSAPSRRTVLGACGAVAGGLVLGRSLSGGGSGNSGTTDRSIAVGEPWSQPRRDVRNAGVSPASSGPGGRPERYWEATFDRRAVRLRTSPVLAGDRLVAASSHDSVALALDAASGDEVWRTDLPGRPEHGPSVDGDDAVVPAGRTVAALDAATGETRWTRELSGVAGPPTVTGETVFVGASDGAGAAYALSRADGTVKWRRSTGLVTGPPAVGDGTVVFADYTATVRAFDRRDGTERWSRRLDGDWIRAAPVVADGTVYACAGTSYHDRGQVRALDVETGRERWTYDLPAVSVAAAPAVTGDAVYVTDGFGRLHALDPDGGSHRWTFDPTAGGDRSVVANSVDTTPAVGADAVYYVGPDGRLLALPLGDGDGAPSPSWRLSTEGRFTAGPILSREFAFVPGVDRLVALGPE